jgi:hypothetical protein
LVGGIAGITTIKEAMGTSIIKVLGASRVALCPYRQRSKVLDYYFEQTSSTASLSPAKAWEKSVKL